MSGESTVSASAAPGVTGAERSTRVLGIPAQGLTLVWQALHRQNRTLSPEFFIFLFTVVLIS